VQCLVTYRRREAVTTGIVAIRFANNVKRAGGYPVLIMEWRIANHKFILIQRCHDLMVLIP
jgi:hypothetical protein